MPDEAAIRAFIGEARKEGISEDAIDAEVEKMLQTAPPSSAVLGSVREGMRIGRGGEVFPHRASTQGVEPSLAMGLAGSLLGPAGAIGGHLAGRGIEGMVARAAGEPGPTPGQVAGETAFMLAAPPAIQKGGELAVAAGRKAVGVGGTLATSLLSKFARVKPATFDTAVAERAVTTKGAIPAAKDIVDEARTAVDELRSTLFPESVEAGRIIRRSGRPVKLGTSVKLLDRAFVRPIGTIQNAARKELQGLLRDLQRATGSKTLDELASKELPAIEANRLKQTLQKLADFSERARDDPSNRILKRVGHNLKLKIEQSLPPGLGDEVRRLNQTIGRKSETLRNLVQRIGTHRKPLRGAESFIENASKRPTDIALLDDFGRITGSDIGRNARLASVIKEFGGQTPSFTSPQITAVGTLMGAAPGGLIGGALGGPLGALVGTLGGMAAGTPAGAIAMGRGVAAAGRGGRAALTAAEGVLDVVRGRMTPAATALGPRIINLINSILRDPQLTPEQKRQQLEQLQQEAAAQ